MNIVILLGRFTRDHNVTHTQSGMMILTNTLAVNRMKKDEADFISVKAVDKTAENINKFFNKGSLICIQGHIQTGKYENKEARTVYTTDVIIDRWDFTGERREEIQTNNNAEFIGIEDDSNDQLPS